MLQVTNLSAHYNGIAALRRVSLHVSKGEIVCLIGANGAGKTTLLNTVCGLVSPSDGEMTFAGKSLLKLKPDRIVRRGVVQVPEGRQVFPGMSVRENLQMGAYLRYKRGEKDEIEENLQKILKRFPILAERYMQPAGILSGGEQQMLAIGRALMASPMILLMDEPSMGLAPKMVLEIFEIIESLRKEGATVLLVEQNARAALKIADRGYVLETGRVVLEGEAAELMEDKEVKRAYLGRDYSHVWER